MTDQVNQRSAAGWSGRVDTTAPSAATPCASSPVESEQRVRDRFASDDFEQTLVSSGMPSPKTAELTVLELHATEPPTRISTPSRR